MNRMKRLSVISLFLLAALASCRIEYDPAVVELSGEDEGGLCDFYIGTRAGGGGSYTDTTFRAQLFYRATTFSARLDSLMSPYSGTYCLPNGSSYLTPCAVDSVLWLYDSSATPPEGSQYGLRGGRGHDYYLFLSSPAVPYVKYDSLYKASPSDTSHRWMYYYGFAYDRGSTLAKDHPAVSGEVKVSTYGLTLQNSYIYSFVDTLREYRSRVAFSVRCGDAIDHCSLKKLEIKNLRRSAIFRPFSQDFLFEENAANYDSVTVYSSPFALGTRLQRDSVVHSADSVTYIPGVTASLTGVSDTLHLSSYTANTHQTYLLSDDYKSLNLSGKYIKSPPTLCITLAADDGSDITMDPIKLAFIYKPQKSCFYRITVNSVYVLIDVAIRDWDEAFTVNEDVTENEDPGETLTLSIRDWTSASNSTTVDPGSGGTTDTIVDSDAGNGITIDDWNNPSGGSGSVD